MAALASPGKEIVFSDDPGVNAIRVTYGADVPSVTSHGVMFLNDPSKADTHIVVSFHDGATADLWVWDTRLDATDVKALAVAPPGGAGLDGAAAVHLDDGFL
jgi:hypothetical protein